MNVSTKKNPDHSWRYKGLLVVKGFLQRWGANMFDTFVPTAKWISLRFFSHVRLPWSVYQTTWREVYADPDEEVIIKVPGIGDRTNPFGLSRP